MTLPINSLINVTLNLAAQPLPVENFSTALFLGPSAVIDVVERYREYADFDEVAADFASNTPEYAAAALWFDQDPEPDSLFIGRWVKTASNGQLIGGAVSAANQSMTVWNAITGGSDGTFTISINATPHNVTGMDFGSVTNMNGVATVIQTALNALVAGTTCVWQSVYNNFVITSPTTGTSSTISFASPEGTGTDISTLMGGTSASGAYEANGLAAESALSAVTLFNTNWPTLWFGLDVLTASTSDVLAVAGFIEALGGQHFYGTTSNDANMLNPSDTTNIAYQLKQLNYNWTTVQYSSTTPHAVASLLARVLTTDWEANNTAITLMYKNEPGVTGENLTTTQAGAISGFNANVFVNYAANNTIAIIQFGTVASGQFIDSVIGAAVLRATIMTNLFNILYLTPTKIPQTDGGMGQLESGIVAGCEEFVNNGLLGPTTWDGPTFGNLKNGQFVPKGYYIYQPPVSSQSPADRGTRISVPFQVAAVLSGAVHKANVQLNVAS